ncbi:Transposase, Mutator family [Acidocella aminolytica 101 = DSM 11237]|nr:Transposase, Mutator family [Acidocella aminolytica 101 = DSM 11237]
MLIAKYQRRFPGFDRKIISMYALGMTTREIPGQIEEIYGVEASFRLISAITDAVMEEVTAWRNRPLAPLISDRLHGPDPGQHPYQRSRCEQGGLS